jgi:biopolymer transport protein ExbD
MDAALSELRVSQPVRVLLDSGRTIPMVWGLFRPTVMLPAEACDWTDAQIRSVFLHELAHIKRRDLASQFLVQIACALHWFNPLVWIAAWRLRVEAEHACDNFVLSKGVRASDYAEHVLHVATRLVPVQGGGAVGLAMARPSRLEGRMMAVLSKGLNRRGVTRVLAMTAVLFSLFVIVPMSMLRAADEKKPAPTKAADVAPADAPKVKQKTPTDGIPDQPEAGPTTLDVGVDGSLTLDGSSVTLQSLPDELSARKANNSNLQLEVYVPSNVPFNRVASVLDVVEKAGAVTVTIRTPDKKGVSRIPAVRPVAEAASADQVREKRSKAAAERDKAKRESDLARMEDERARVDVVRADVARLKLRQAEAQLKRMEQLSADNLISNSELDQARLEVGRWKAESVVDSKEKLKADLELAEAELALNQANYRRTAELFDKNLVAQSEMEMAKAERAIAQAKLRAAKAKLDSDAANSYGRTSPVANPAKKERLLKILDDEIQVAAAQAKLVREQHSQGRANIESVFRADFEVMALQRERASMMGEPAAVKDLITQQIGVLQELEKATREQRREGVESESEALKVRRQILMLQRQQAQMDF